MSMEPPGELTLFLHRSGSIYYLIMDMQGKYTYVNELYKKIFLSSPEESQDEYFQNSVIPEDIALFNKTINECLAEPATSVCVDLRRSRNDKSLFLDKVGIKSHC